MTALLEAMPLVLRRDFRKFAARARQANSPRTTVLSDLRADRTALSTVRPTLRSFESVPNVRIRNGVDPFITKCGRITGLSFTSKKNDLWSLPDPESFDASVSRPQKTVIHSA